MTTIDVRPYQAGDLVNSGWLPKTTAEASESQIRPTDPAYTGRAPDGRVLWVAALQIQGDPAHAVAWLALPAGTARKYPRTFFEVRRVLMQHAKDLRRVTAYVQVARDEAARFLEHMGFQREGRLRAFGIDGGDYYVYGLVPGEEE